VGGHKATTGVNFGYTVNMQVDVSVYLTNIPALHSMKEFNLSCTKKKAQPSGPRFGFVL
jgi:hypothetical protein